MKTTFAHCLAACGLSIDDAAELLGKSRSIVEKKSRGVRDMTPEDAKALADVWHRIRQGEAEGLPEGAVEMIAALRMLRGVESIEQKPKGRKKRPADAGEDDGFESI